MQEAADRFTDTSWQIHRQWRSDTNTAFPTAQNSNTPKEGTPKSITSNKAITTDTTKGNNSNGSIPNGIIKHAGDDTTTRKVNGSPTAAKVEPEIRKVVQIETVQTTCETIARPEKIKTEVVLVR